MSVGVLFFAPPIIHASLRMRLARACLPVDNLAGVAREVVMPFDCTPFSDAPKSSAAFTRDTLDGETKSPKAQGMVARPVPAWHASRRPECVRDTLAILGRARELLVDERRWCQRSFARGWLDIPVPSQSPFARRYCALGAIMRAGRELGLPVKEATKALEWQTVRPVPDWNDDPRRTHADVIATFDSAIAALDRSTV
jgi:hypothetical protein